jgi:hypothetical protein
MINSRARKSVRAVQSIALGEVSRTRKRSILGSLGDGRAVYQISQRWHIVAGDHAILGLAWRDPRRIQLTDEKRRLSSETELPMRVAARSELHAKVIRQDRVVLHELGKWGLIGPPEPDLHPSLVCHGR